MSLGTKTMRPLDGALMVMDRDRANVSICWLLRFEGPPVSLAELRAHLGQRIMDPNLARFRQHAVRTRGRWRWKIDPAFDIANHVTELTGARFGLPLNEIAARQVSRPLARDRPLWSWALVSRGPESFDCVVRVHHALYDAIGGANALAQLIGSDARAEQQLIARPRLHRRIRGLAATAVATTRPRTRSQLNGRQGADRAVVLLSADLDAIQTVGRSFSATVNDVYLSIIAGALRRDQMARGNPAPRDPLTAVVPVSFRRAGQSLEPGNYVGVVGVDLPVDVADPVGRLSRVSRSMSRVKHTDLGLGATTFGSIATPLTALSIKLIYRVLANVQVSGIAGPGTPWSLLGRTASDAWAVGPLYENHLCSVLELSYAGRFNVALLLDANGCTDSSRFEDHLRLALEELLERAAVTPEPVMSR